MNKTQISSEDIENYLQGNDPQKYIVSVEAPYYQNVASLVINDPELGKYIERVTYKPFVWMSHDMSKIMFNGNRTKIAQAMKDYSVTISDLTIKDGNGFIPSRMDNGYKYIVKTTLSYTNLLNFFKSGGVDIYSEEHRKYFMYISPTEQFLIQTGKRLFKGFGDYNDLHRLQFDLETTGLKPSTSSIFQIGIKDNRGYERVLEVKGNDEFELRESERLLIFEFFNIVDELKPDVISGYNSENFDWDFFFVRCEKLGISITEASTTLNDSKIVRKAARVKYGGDTEDYEQTYMWGYNIIDIMHSVRRAMAINSDIKEYGLKYITKFSKIAKPNRVYVPGNKIHSTWADTTNNYYFNDDNGDWFIEDSENARNVEKINGEYHSYVKVSGSFIVHRYLLDDLWETEKIDERFNQATFLLGKIIPTSYMRSSTMGTAGIWKLIMMGWSYENGLGIPQLQSQETFVGGLSRLLEVGYAVNVGKLDYAALYPNIELTWDIFPDIDISGVMKGMLLYIAETRDVYKAIKGEHNVKASKLKDKFSLLDELSEEYIKLKKEYDIEKGLEDKFDKKQLPLKILANSFFGSFGAPHLFPWGDIDCAEETTCRGRQYLRLMVSHFHEGYNFRPLVGDSVTFDTPIYVKWKNDNKLDILPISDVFNVNSDVFDETGLRDLEVKPYEVLTVNGWREINYVYRHKTNKKIHRVSTKDRLVCVTEDHSLFQNGIQVKPSDLKRGDLLDVHKIPNLGDFHNAEIIDDDLYFLYGYFLGGGSYENDTFNISGGSLSDLERLQKIISIKFLIDYKLIDLRGTNGVYSLTYNSVELVKIFGSEFYTSYGDKKIPCFILNTNDSNKLSFLNGFSSYDNYVDELETSSFLGLKSQVAMSGIAYLMDNLNLNKEIISKKGDNELMTFRVESINDVNPELINKMKSNEVWLNEVIMNGCPNGYVYDISTQDGTFIGGIGGIDLKNTDGFNFAIPDSVEDIQYYVKGNHRLTEYNKGKTLTGLNAVVAEFNEVYMIGRMGLDIDDICNSTINFSRKNYANDIGGKIKLVGNTIKSKKMPTYIEEFLGKGCKLLLEGNGKDFITLYQDTVDNIVNYDIPLVKIASKAKVKISKETYAKKMKTKNKAGNMAAKQAHMELMVAHDLELNLGDVIYYVNTGTLKSHGDIKTIKEANGSTRVEMMCKLISAEEIERNPDLTTDGYNAPKYLAAFNKRINPLLVCFEPEVRKLLIMDLVKNTKTKEMELTEKNYFTDEQCVLISGKPFLDSDQDTYTDLMIMEDKEIVFWLRVDKIPNNMLETEWVETVADYHERMRLARLDGIERDVKLFPKVVRRLEYHELEEIRGKGVLPKDLDFITLEPVILDGEVSEINVHSKKWGVIIGKFDDIFSYETLAKERSEFYEDRAEAKGLELNISKIKIMDYYEWLFDKLAIVTTYAKLKRNRTLNLVEYLNNVENQFFNNIKKEQPKLFVGDTLEILEIKDDVLPSDDYEFSIF